MQWIVTKDNPLASVDSSSPWTRFNFRYLLLGIALSLVSAHIAVAHPNMYLNRVEIDAIKLKVDAGEAPWTTAYSRVIASANAALNRAPESVIDWGPGTPGARLYASAPRPRPGRPGDTVAFVRADYFAAIRVKERVRDLGLAYAFTGEGHYADKAIEFIEHWSLDSVTGMRTTPGNSIETFITMPGYFYGADLISDYGGWAPDRKEAFEGWVREIGTKVRNRGEGPNNFANWKTVMMASVGSFLHDDSNNGFIDYAETEWKRWLPIQMNGAGSSRAGLMGQEVSRTDGLHYSLYALNAMIQGAEILLQEGVNVYDYVDPNTGQSLKLGLDFILPYALDPRKWGTDTATRTYTQNATITANNSMALFELAYSYYQDPAYLAVINRWGRPMNEIRPMGNVTLTHGNTFDLNIIPEPSTGLMVAMCCGILAMRRRRA